MNVCLEEERGDIFYKIQTAHQKWPNRNLGTNFGGKSMNQTIVLLTFITFLNVIKIILFHVSSIVSYVN